MGTMMQDLAFAIPGVDEAMSFAEIMKYVPFVSFLRKRGGGNLTVMTIYVMRFADVDAQARQVDGILRDRVRHSPYWTHATLSLLSHRPRKGAWEAVSAERAYRAHDQSGKLMPFAARPLFVSLFVP